MTVTTGEDGAIELRGVCGSEDAEALLRLLLEAPHASVDWRTCEGAHAAVVQVLMAAGRTIRGPPLDPFLRDLVEPGLKPR